MWLMKTYIFTIYYDVMQVYYLGFKMNGSALLQCQIAENVDGLWLRQQQKQFPSWDVWFH